MKPLFIKKNGTVSKVSGIIMNLIPSYTMAEYNALTHKPLLWVRTDEDYAQIPSEDVSYGSGSVKDALDSSSVKQFTIASGETVTLEDVFCVMLRTSGTSSGIHIINMAWGSYAYVIGGSTGCTLSASRYNLTITNNNAYSIACVQLMKAI